MEELSVDWIDSIHSTGEAEGQQERRARAGGRLVLGGVVMSVVTFSCRDGSFSVLLPRFGSV